MPGHPIYPTLQLPPTWACPGAPVGVSRESSSSEPNPPRRGATGALGAARRVLRRQHSWVTFLPLSGAGGHPLVSRPLNQSRALSGCSRARGTSCVGLKSTLLPLLARTAGACCGRRLLAGPVKPQARTSWPGAHAPPWEPERLGVHIPDRHHKVSRPQPSIPESLHLPHLHPGVFHPRFSAPLPSKQGSLYPCRAS